MARPLFPDLKSNPVKRPNPQSFRRQSGKVQEPECKANKPDRLPNIDCKKVEYAAH